MSLITERLVTDFPLPDAERLALPEFESYAVDGFHDAIFGLKVRFQVIDREYCSVVIAH
jgi:hypothetical protein